LKNEIISGDFDFVAKELMEKYYDPMYGFKSGKLDYAGKFKTKTNSHDTAMEILHWYNENIKYNKFFIFYNYKNL
jgi:hypothetical protein